MTPPSRSRFLRWLYLVAPFVSAMGTDAFFANGLDRWLQKQAPIDLAGYALAVIRIIPFSWIALTLGCAFGSALDYIRRTRLTGPRFAFYLILCTYLVFAAQLLVCETLARFVFGDRSQFRL